MLCHGWGVSGDEADARFGDVRPSEPHARNQRKARVRAGRPARSDSPNLERPAAAVRTIAIVLPRPRVARSQRRRSDHATRRQRRECFAPTIPLSSPAAIDVRGNNAAHSSRPVARSKTRSPGRKVRPSALADRRSCSGRHRGIRRDRYVVSAHWCLLHVATRQSTHQSLRSRRTVRRIPGPAPAPGNTGLLED